MMYKLLKDYQLGKEFGAIRFDENSATSFSFDLANTDYQQYLAWVAEGNTPTPADEGTQ